MIALILLMHPHVYICGHMYACMYACMYVLQYTRPPPPPPPPPSIEVDLAGLAIPSPSPILKNFLGLCTPKIQISQKYPISL